jgi:hypothetical protein
MALAIKAEHCYAECHIKILYAECHYAECRYAEPSGAVAEPESLVILPNFGLIYLCKKLYSIDYDLDKWRKKVFRFRLYFH